MDVDVDEEGWGLGTSGYLKSGLLSPGESRECRSKFFCLPMMMKAQGRERTQLDLASRRPALACGERCNRMTHQATPFTLCWICYPTQRGGDSKHARSACGQITLFIAGRGGNTASPPGFQYPRQTTARDKSLKHSSMLRRQKSPRAYDGAIASACKPTSPGSFTVVVLV